MSIAAITCCLNTLVKFIITKLLIHFCLTEFEMKMINALRYVLFGLVCFSGVTIAAAIQQKPVYGPLAVPNDQNLAFYRMANNHVEAYFSSAIIGDYRQTNDTEYDLGDVKIVAAFCFDLNKGGEDEVIVMYRDTTGEPHIRAWGDNGVEMEPLTQLTPALDNIAARLDTFTVSSVRKAIGQMP